MATLLYDRIQETDLLEKDKVLLQMFPGMLFGFVPENFREIEKRLDCKHCLCIALKLNQLADIDKLSLIKRIWLISKALRIQSEIESTMERDTAHWGADEDKRKSAELFARLLSGRHYEITVIDARPAKSEQT